MLQDCGEYSNQYTPSFIQYKICHTESATASVMTPDKPDSCLVTTRHIHDLSTVTYNEVCSTACPESLPVQHIICTSASVRVVYYVYTCANASCRGVVLL